MTEGKNEAVAALVRAQASIQKAEKNATNPAFKQKYADLGSVMDACKDALNAEGFAVVQIPTTRRDSQGDFMVSVETRLVHDETGESFSAALEIPVGKHDAQGVGSAITYGRRFTLASLVGVVQADDDGQGAASSSAADQEMGYLIDHNAAVRRNIDSICRIKLALVEPSQWSVAFECISELEESEAGNEMRRLWRAPSKGGIFSTEELRIMKSDEFQADRRTWAQGGEV